MAYEDLKNESCSIARPLSVLGDRWTLVILRQSFGGIRRFEQFRSTLGVSAALLSDRLSGLVNAGILEMHDYQDVRRTRQEYRLTEKGLDLYPVLMALRTWGDKYMAPDGPFVLYKHQGCGGEAEIHHTCNKCGQEISAREVSPEPGPGLLALAPK